MIFRFFKNRRRARVRRQPFPEEWRAHIERNVPYVAMLEPAEQEELEGHILVFLDEKTFEGMEGISVDDEMRVTIAAQACILLLGRRTDFYPNLETIIVYPAAYVARTLRRGPGGATIESVETRLGESWSSGQMVLSWDDSLKGAADVRDGHNVVMHEFAHQLDGEWTGGEGAPRLSERSMYATWASVLGKEFEALTDDMERHRKTVLDKYGATNPAEFFAVATEAFFERPTALKRKHPELYDQLRGFYMQDPAKRYR